MIRLSALLLAGCVVSTGLILVGPGSASRDSPLFERSSPATEIKTGAQAREIAEQLLGPAQRPPEAASSDNAGDPRPPDVRLSGIVIEPDRRIAILAVDGTKSVVVSEGEALNDWRIDSISPQKVSLSGPAGTMTLKPKPDANLVRPAPPAAPPAGQPQPGVPPRFLHRSFQWFPAPAGAPEQPTAATLIAAESAPAPVQAQGYSYIDCINPYYWQSCQEHYGYNEDYVPYGYDYSLPYYAYGVPVASGSGLSSFIIMTFITVASTAVSLVVASVAVASVAVVSMVVSMVVSVAVVFMAAVVVTAGIADALFGFP